MSNVPIIKINDEEINLNNEETNLNSKEINPTDETRKAISKAYELTDNKIHNNIHKKHEFRRQMILDDKSLTKDEKEMAVNYLEQMYDSDKVLYNEGTKRSCNECKNECLATSYCEFCIRIYLEASFTNWTSGNVDIDKLIRKCQTETLKPDMVIEWIPYDKLKNIEYLKKGGCSEIYTANWIDGRYVEWDSKNQRLKRFGSQEVILKRLENSEGARRWFEEVCYIII
jgi:hypothetical protein